MEEEFPIETGLTVRIKPTWGLNESPFEFVLPEEPEPEFHYSPGLTLDLSPPAPGFGELDPEELEMPPDVGEADPSDLPPFDDIIL